MKHIILYFIFLFFIKSAFSQNEVIPYKLKNNKWVFVKRKSLLKVSEEFDEIKYLDYGVYQVKKDRLVGLNNIFGKKLLDVKYKPLPTIIKFSDGMYPLYKNDTLLFFDTKGKIKFKWQSERFPHEFVYFKNGLLFTKEGFINKNGKTIIPKGEYDVMDSFDENGLTAITTKNQEGKMLWGVLDKTGKIILPINFNFLEIKNDHILASDYIDKAQNLLNLKGKPLLKQRYDGLVAYIKNGLFVCRKIKDEYYTCLRRMSDEKIILDGYDNYQILSNGKILTDSLLVQGKNYRSHFTLFNALGNKLKVVGVFKRFSEIKEKPGFFHCEDSLGIESIRNISGEKILDFSDSLEVVDKYKSGITVANKFTKKTGFVFYNNKNNLPCIYDGLIYNEELKLFQIYRKNDFFFMDKFGTKYIDNDF
jgi:hypothetical protein